MLEVALAGAIAGYAIAIPVGAIAVLIIHSAVTQAVFGSAVGRGSSHRVRLATVVIGNVVVLGLGLLIVAQALVAGGFL